MKTKLSLLGALFALAALVSSLAADSTGQTEKMRFAGTVVDSNGKPVAGAVVELYELGRGLPGTGTEGKAQQTTTTAANGAYDFQAPAGATVVFAYKAGLAPAWASYWNPQTDVTDEQLVLTPPASIHGIVVDDADKPVADARVFVTTAYAEMPAEGGGRRLAYLSRMPNREQFSARTGPDGKFQIDGCPTNAAVDLGVKKAGKVLREPKRQNVGPDTMRCRPGKAEVKLVLDEAGMVEGKVRSQETGQPLAGVSIFLRRTDPGSYGVAATEPAQSAEDGTFRMTEVAPGSYRAHASFSTNVPPDLVADTVALNVEAGKTTRDIEIAATKGGFLEVAALSKDDRTPVPRINVSVFKQDYTAAEQTGSNGVALLRLPTGKYQIAAYREGSRSEQVSATIEAGTTNRAEVEIAPPLRIRGSVRDPAGAPVAGLQLRVVPRYRANTGMIKTDDEGRFEFTWNPRQFGGQNNTFCLLARDVKRNLAAAADIEESTSKLDLQLEPGLTIVGRVEDMNGKPLTNATANLYLWTGNSGDSFTDKPIRTDAQGRFEVSALPADRRYSVHTTAKGYGSGDSRIQSADTETKSLELPTFTLAVADRKLAGQVVDSDDKPVANAWVNMYGRGQPNASTRSDDQGRFRFEEACEGRVQVYANADRAYGSVSVEAGDTNVVLKLGVNQFAQEAPRRPSLKGKPLPDLTALGLQADRVPAGKLILLCLFDIEQRPCRRFTRLLAEQHDSLRQKGLVVLGLQAAITSADTLKEWKDDNSPPYPVGQLLEKNNRAKWASQVESMPWLILTDADHKVVAEGFALDEIDAKLKEVGK